MIAIAMAHPTRHESLPHDAFLCVRKSEPSGLYGLSNLQFIHLALDMIFLFYWLHKYSVGHIWIVGTIEHWTGRLTSGHYRHPSPGTPRAQCRRPGEISKTKHTEQVLARESLLMFQRLHRTQGCLQTRDRSRCPKLAQCLEEYRIWSKTPPYSPGYVFGRLYPIQPTSGR